MAKNLTVGNHVLWIPIPERRSAQEIADSYGAILLELADQLPDNHVASGPTSRVESAGKLCFVRVEVEMAQHPVLDATLGGFRVYDDVLAKHGFTPAKRATDPSGRDYTVAKRRRGGHALFSQHWQSDKRLTMLVPTTKRGCASADARDG